MSKNFFSSIPFVISAAISPDVVLVVFHATKKVHTIIRNKMKIIKNNIYNYGTEKMITRATGRGEERRVFKKKNTQL